MAKDQNTDNGGSSYKPQFKTYESRDEAITALEEQIIEKDGKFYFKEAFDIDSKLGSLTRKNQIKIGEKKELESKISELEAQVGTLEDQAIEKDDKIALLSKNDNPDDRTKELTSQLDESRRELRDLQNKAKKEYEPMKTQLEQALQQIGEFKGKESRASILSGIITAMKEEKVPQHVIDADASLHVSNFEEVDGEYFTRDDDRMTFGQYVQKCQESRPHWNPNTTPSSANPGDGSNPYGGGSQLDFAGLANGQTGGLIGSM